jgi:acetylornithine/N-succinyldiaminopimelate aminotransferase
MSKWMEMEKKYYMPTFQRMPVVLVRGQGARVWDDAGREYLDFIGGLAVNSLGHCHPVVARALAEQGQTLTQTSNLFYSVPQVQLAELLVNNSCFDKAFFCNSGTEANEGAVKLARRYGKLNLDGAFEVITTFGSFHGRTLAMTAATGQQKFQEPYAPMPSGFVNVEADSVEAIKKATTKQTCAVMLEPIQAEGGVNVPPEDYLKKVRDWCDQAGILLILDEIQTGVGRLGSLFGYQVYGIEPDIITLAKGMGGGIPIGAFLAKSRADVFKAGDHGTTFGGNPLACAVSLAVMEYIIKYDVAGNAQRMGAYLASCLSELAAGFGSIVEVRGRGLLWAIEFEKDMAEAVMLGCIEKGLLVNKLKPNAVRLIPPLIITRKDVDQAVTALREVLSGPI